MTNLDLHQLRAFVAVSRHGSVARAAPALRMTASPVSRTLRELERTTGPLFERGYHDMRLTEQGRRLLPLAVGSVRQADDLVLVARGEEPPIRWAATPWMPERFALGLRDAVLDQGAATEVDGAVSATLLHRMVHGEIDVAMVHLPVAAAGIASAPIARYRFALAVSPEDALAGRPGVISDDLRGRRVLMLPRSMQPDAMAGLHEWVRRAGAQTVEEIALADMPLLAGRLRREQAVTLGVTDGGTPVPGGPGVAWVPFADEPYEFLLGVAWRRDDPVRRERLEAIAGAVRPSGDILAVID